jgi:acetyltransferase-like isoleucine patch superfamily enzyme
MRIIPGRLIFRWRRYWVRRAGPSGLGRLAARLAAWNTTPFHGRVFLSTYDARGFVAHNASLDHPRVRRGARVYIGDHVMISGGVDSGEIELRDGVQLYGDTFMHSGSGARITIDAGAHIQPGCHIHASLADIRIGRNVEIAPCCAFYSYDHAIAPGIPVREQSLQTKGPISIGDDAWLGHGVIVLSGVRIGAGAVIGAGSVVSSDIPDNAIAVGVPARVIKFRDGRPAAIDAAVSRQR